MAMITKQAARQEMARRKIGILGGSFNPAHHGHLQISLSALTLCGLDEIWWLVSLQNPLKEKGDMAPFSKRMSEAKSVIANHPRIKLLDIEKRLGITYTAQTIRYLRRRFPKDDFIWIMGADNLQQFHSWKNWQDILALVPIAVFNRPGYTYQALGARSAKRFSRYRRPEKMAHLLAGEKRPAWIFLHDRLNPISATAIRSARNGQ